VVFIDGHISRFDVQRLRELRQAGIYLVLYLPNFTSKMQPPDVGFFAQLKRKMKQNLQSRRATNHEQVSVADRIAIIGEAFQECNDRQYILRSIEKSGLNPFTRQVHFDDPVLQRNDWMLRRKEVGDCWRISWWAAAFSVPVEIPNRDDGEAMSHAVSEESPVVSSAASSSNIVTSVSKQLAKAPESLDSISAFLKTRSREELEIEAHEILEQLSGFSSSIKEQKRKMIQDRRAAQPDTHVLLTAKEQAFRNELVEFHRSFAREEADAIERVALAANGKRSRKKRARSSGNFRKRSRKLLK